MFESHPELRTLQELATQERRDEAIRVRHLQSAKLTEEAANTTATGGAPEKKT